MDNEKTRQTLKTLGGSLLGVFLVILFYYKTDYNWHEVIRDILNSGWLILLGASFFTGVLCYLSAAKWKLILDNLLDNKTTISTFHLFHYSALGFIFTFFLPRAVSDVGIKSLMLNRIYHVPYKTGIYSVLLDQFFNLIISLIFLIPGIALMTDVQNIQTVLILNLIGLFVFTIIFYYFSKPVLSLLARLYAFSIQLIQKLRFLKEKENRELWILTSDFHIHSDTARKVFFLTLLRQLPTVMRLYVIVLLLDLDISFYYLLVSCSVMLLFGLVTIIPAQLGIGEWGWYAMLALAGLPDSQIVMFVLSTRVYSNLSIIIIFLLSWCCNRTWFSSSGLPFAKKLNVKAE